MWPLPRFRLPAVSPDSQDIQEPAAEASHKVLAAEQVLMHRVVQWEPAQAQTAGYSVESQDRVNTD
ncbi:hypothetical protein TCA2_4240 [Paenibacillus sp. TCA20]|nr:hypothetical protein TCA2_4240 [Paenibacillus sp. TCA20]